MWGVLWLIIAFAFFAAGVVVGLAAFKVRVPTIPFPVPCIISDSDSNRLLPHFFFQESSAQQAEDAKHFLPVPGSSGALQLLPANLSSMVLCVSATLAVLLPRWRLV